MFRNSSGTQNSGPQLLALFASKDNATKKTKKILQFLKKYHVPTQFLFEENNTLLHLAVEHDLPQLAEALVATCPELMGFRNIHRTTPITLARERHNQGLLTLFKQAVFPVSTPPPVSKDEFAQLTQQFSELKIFKKPEDDRPTSTSAFTKINEIIQKNATLVASLESELEELLLYCGFEYQEEAVLPFTQNPVWALCASLSREDDVVARKVFDKQYTAQVVQGLLAMKPASDILQDIHDLWVAFDKGQKLTAIFVVKELVIRDPNCQLLKEDHSEALEALFEKIKSDFKSHASMMTRLLKNLVNTNKGLQNNPAYSKYRKHCRRTLSSERSAGERSFEQLLLETAELKTKKQQSNITLITNEFDSLSLSFFHNVELSEYYQCAWQGEQREVTSPNIVRHTEFFNQASNFIQNFILQASSNEEFAARFSLFVRVAARLAQPHNGMPPNLDGIMLIMLSIDSFNIVRAKSCTERLSADDKKQLEQLRKMVDPLGGFKNYREIVKAAKFALVSSGRVQTEISLAYENEELQHRLETTGKALLNFLDFQKEARTIPFRFKTDLVHQLASKQHDFDETHQLCLSGKFAPIMLEAMTPKMFEDFLNTIINTKIIPNMSFDGNYYPPEGIIIPVVAKLKEIAESDTDDEYKKELLINAKKLVIKLTKLINKEFDLAQAAPKLSPILSKRSNSIEVEHPPTLLLSKKLSDLRRNQSYSTIAVPAQRQRKRLSIGN
ncbi:MAG: RasGEF domain-containing protein [Candidatus Berkiella sp.]